MTSKKDISEDLERDLERLLGWVRSAESRLALVLPLSTTMLGALCVLAPEASKWSVPGGIFTSIAGLLLAGSIVCSALASFPRTSGPKGSLIFFGGIAETELEQYSKAVRKRTDEEYLIDLEAQCHRNAKIAQRKYYWVQWSMGAMFAGALPWVIALYLLYSGGA